jgi:Ankyrin repeats (3 copies)/Ankyrin repeat
MKHLVKFLLLLAALYAVSIGRAYADTPAPVCRPAKPSPNNPIDPALLIVVPATVIATDKCLEEHYNPNDLTTNYDQMAFTLQWVGTRSLLAGAQGLSVHQRVLILNDYAFWEFKTNNVVEMPDVIRILKLVVSLSPNRTAAWLNLGDAYRYEIEMSFPPDENFQRGITPQQKAELAAEALDAYQHYLALSPAPMQRVRDYVALATSPVTADTAGWSTLDAIEHMADRPAVAAKFLRDDHDPAAKLALAMDMALILPNPGAHTDEINQLMNDSVEGVDVTPPQGGFDGSAASFVPYLQAEGRRQQATEFQRFPIPCQLAEKYPDLMQAAQVQGDGFIDNFDPVIVCTDSRYQLPPSVLTFEDDLRGPSGYYAMCDTSTQQDLILGTWFDESVVRYTPRALLPPFTALGSDPNDNLPPLGQQEQTDMQRLGIGPETLPLEVWGETDIDSYNKAKKIAADFLKARADLAAYYRSSFGLSSADSQAAAMNGVWMIENAYFWAGAGTPDPLAEALLGHRPLAQVQAAMAKEAPIPDTTLFLAVEYPEALKLLLAQKPDLTVTTPIGKTVLMEAAKYDQLESVSLLLAAGADVNATSLPPDQITENSQLFPNNNGICGGLYAITHGSRTALMYAAANADLPVIKALLATGADKRAKDSMGARALDYLEGRGPVAKNSVLSAGDFKTAEALLMP